MLRFEIWTARGCSLWTDAQNSTEVPDRTPCLCHCGFLHPAQCFPFLVISRLPALSSHNVLKLCPHSLLCSIWVRGTPYQCNHNKNKSKKLFLVGNALSYLRYTSWYVRIKTYTLAFVFLQVAPQRSATWVTWLDTETYFDDHWLSGIDLKSILIWKSFRLLEKTLHGHPWQSNEESKNWKSSISWKKSQLIWPHFRLDFLHFLQQTCDLVNVQTFWESVQRGEIT